MTERPVDNAPYQSLTHAGLTVEGYSRAAVQSYWRVPELKIGFDLGAQPWDFMGTPNWFISHTHLDHIAALPVYVARRRMMKMEPPRVFVPAESYEDVKKFLLILQRLDRGRQTCDLVPVEPGQEIELSRDHVATVFATTHTIPSCGLLVWERRNKLKEEYQGLPGERIRDLRLSGTPVTREVRLPLVCYTGDTSPAGLDNYPPVYEAKILITELSFIRASHRRDKIHKFGHMHLDDFLERADRFKNELIVAAHFSTRYHPTEIYRLLEKKLPPTLQERMRLWV
ncbi:MBL fold metallo-hydrolase [Fimbriiglobus ruber]|uniref:Metal-dependent hydrolases of the beta-lactamase superfamily III n=1 Tax=Fimbriiglobus ruber TaxID=1908690 RepID=A0A225DER2_9BACT|nr:MBL fold metallo-hydrolase [Fimbriiglobus ruber]OWK34875.1 Metal-dependent hydrolases of the beta-lactamase superfamily III [Fimbriiglobus ruber]